MNSPFSRREKLLCLSRSYTFTNAIYVAPVTVFLSLCLTFTLASGGQSGQLSSFDPRAREVLWLVIWVAALILWLAHSNWRSAMIETGHLPRSTLALWTGSILLNATVICCYLFQTKERLDGELWLKDWEPQMVAIMFPASALVAAVLGLRMSIRANRKTLHKRRQRLS